MRQIRRRNGDIFRDRGRAGISGRTKYAIDRRRLFQFPNQRVLAAAAPDDKNFHCPTVVASAVRGYLVNERRAILPARSVIPISQCAE